MQKMNIGILVAVVLVLIIIAAMLSNRFESDAHKDQVAAQSKTDLLYGKGKDSATVNAESLERDKRRNENLERSKAFKENSEKLTALQQQLANETNATNKAQLEKEITVLRAKIFSN